MREFETIGYVLESVLTGLEMGARTKEYLALILWPDIVGETVARMTSVQSVRNGVLYVDVESPVWAQELQFYKPDMIARVNKHVGSEAVREIQFRIRSTPRRPPPGDAAAAPRRQKNLTPEIQLTLEECQEIEQTAQQVQEPELREALTSTMASYRRLERWMTVQGWKRCKDCKALFRRKRGCPFCTM